MERVTALERVQIGVEATPGTLVDADQRLHTLMITPQARVNSRALPGLGSKSPVVQVVGREHTEASLEGPASYDELAYLLAAHLCVPSTSGDALLFEPQSESEDTIKTLTVEVGNEDIAEAFGYGFVRSLQFRATGVEVAVSGTMIGQALAVGQTLTAAPDDVPAVVITEKDWVVKIDDLAGGTPVTLERVDEFEWSSQDKWRERFYANQGASWELPLGGRWNQTLRLSLQYDTEANALMAGMRNGETYLVVFEAAGPAIDVDTDYALNLKFAARVTSIERQEVDEVTNAQAEFVVVHHPDFNTTGGAMTALLTCTVTGLAPAP
ncbi:MAG: hypothetical protein ACK47B_10995 [Armatimonadota bacterium]